MLLNLNMGEDAGMASSPRAKRPRPAAAAGERDEAAYSLGRESVVRQVRGQSPQRLRVRFASRLLTLAAAPSVAQVRQLSQLAEARALSREEILVYIRAIVGGALPHRRAPPPPPPPPPLTPPHGPLR